MPLLYSSRTNFHDGVVARGQITVKQANTQHTCLIGGSAGGSCSCSPTAECSQELSCFGSLCDHSKLALVPNTTYKVSCKWQLAGCPLAVQTTWECRVCVTYNMVLFNTPIMCMFATLCHA